MIHSMIGTLLLPPPSPPSSKGTHLDKFHGEPNRRSLDAIISITSWLIHIFWTPKNGWIWFRSKDNNENQISNNNCNKRILEYTHTPESRRTEEERREKEYICPLPQTQALAHTECVPKIPKLQEKNERITAKKESETSREREQHVANNNNIKNSHSSSSSSNDSPKQIFHGNEKEIEIVVKQRAK